MSRSIEADARRAEQRTFFAAVAVAIATSVHHAYGAVIYHTPWRYDAIAVSAGTLLFMFAAMRWSRAAPRAFSGRTAWWMFWGVNAAVFVLLLGLFEGVYNHAIKDLLYFGGAQLSVMRALFPAPRYELPNDWFFELTGVLQVVPSALAAYELGGLLSHRPGRAVATRPVATRAMVGKLAGVARWSMRLTGAVEIILGVAFWSGRAVSLRPVHMLVGMVFDLAFLTFIVLAARAGIRAAAVAGSSILALVIPLFGVVQTRLLIGSAHWVVRSAHLLQVLIAMVVAARLGRFVASATAAVGREASQSLTTIPRYPGFASRIREAGDFDRVHVDGGRAAVKAKQSLPFGDGGTDA